MWNSAGSICIFKCVAYLFIYDSCLFAGHLYICTVLINIYLQRIDALIVLTIKENKQLISIKKHYPMLKQQINGGHIFRRLFFE